MRLCTFEWDASLIMWKLQHRIQDYEEVAECKLCNGQLSVVVLAIKREEILICNQLY